MAADDSRRPHAAQRVGPDVIDRILREFSDVARHVGLFTPQCAVQAGPADRDHRDVLTAFDIDGLGYLTGVPSCAARPLMRAATELRRLQQYLLSSRVVLDGDINVTRWRRHHKCVPSEAISRDRAVRFKSTRMPLLQAPVAGPSGRGAATSDLGGGAGDVMDRSLGHELAVTGGKGTMTVIDLIPRLQRDLHEMKQQMHDVFVSLRSTSKTLMMLHDLDRAFKSLTEYVVSAPQLQSSSFESAVRLVCRVAGACGI